MSKPPPTNTRSTPSNFNNLDRTDPKPAKKKRLRAMLHTSDEARSKCGDKEPDNDVLCFSAVDLSDAFCQLGRQGLSSFMCLDNQVSAGHFNIHDVYDEVLD